MFAASLALLANAFDGRDRGTAFAIWGATNGVAVAMGRCRRRSRAAWLALDLLLNIPIGVAAIVLTLLRVDESSSPHPGRVDWLAPPP